jgi:hypothetical protein
MDARLVRTRARDLDATWIGREMMVDRAVGALSDIEWGHGRITALYVGGQRVPVTRDTVAIYDTLGGAVGRNTLPAVSPNQPKTPVRTVRVDDPRWARVKAAAAQRGITASDFIREAIDSQLGAQEDGEG